MQADRPESADGCPHRRYLSTLAGLPVPRRAVVASGLCASSRLSLSEGYRWPIDRCPPVSSETAKIAFEQFTTAPRQLVISEMRLGEGRAVGRMQPFPSTAGGPKRPAELSLRLALASQATSAWILRWQGERGAYPIG